MADNAAFTKRIRYRWNEIVIGVDPPLLDRETATRPGSRNGAHVDAVCCVP